MTTMLDLEAWLVRAALSDRHEARALFNAVKDACAVDGFDCVAQPGAASWLVWSPHAQDALLLPTPTHRKVLLGMLVQRHGLAEAASSRLAHWRLPPHVSHLRP